MATPRIPTRGAQFIDPEAERIRGRSALEALRGYAGAPSQSSAMYPGSQEAYESGELAGMAEMLIPGAAMAKGALGAALAGVIKPRGGNWLTGSVENVLKPLSRREFGPESIQQQRDALEFARNRGYSEEMIRELERAVRQREAPAALNRWIEGPLTKYVKRDMATPEDPVRRLAEEGVTHFGFPEGVYLPAGIQAARDAAGFPKKGLATSRAARSWETLADFAADPMGASEYAQNPRLLAENPWLSKLNPEAHVYGMPRGSRVELGFDHLVDELSNALNPDSGLPRNLLLRPEQMQQMSMEKAVRHVDAVNKWRESQRAAANAELANKAMAVREYPDTPELPNPKGLRWVELRAGDLPEKLPEGYQLHRYGEDKYDLIGPGGKPIASGSRDDVAKAFGRPDLEKQLKYEGDTMGHCVGGYCPDVLEGKSRIFSLRDAKGEPHVTVEVNPAGEWLKRPGAIDENPIVKAEWPEFYRDLVRRVNGNPSPEDIATFKDYMLTKYPDDQSVAAFFGPAFKIAQIKGKQNLKPKDEYLPFVQDFVRNPPSGGQWSDIGDLGNTGLARFTGNSELAHMGGRFNIPPGLYSAAELRRMAKEAGVADDEIESLVSRYKFAEGGAVRAPAGNWRRMDLGGTIGYLMEG